MKLSTKFLTLVIAFISLLQLITAELEITDDFFYPFCGPDFADRSAIFQPTFDESPPDNVCNSGAAVTIESQSLPYYPDTNTTFVWIANDGLACEIEIFNIE